VADTSVLIDLHHGGILEAAFTLPFHWLTPDVILAEAHNPDGSELLAFGLEVGPLSGEQILEVADLVSKYRRVSTNDLFALVLAKHTAATLLTGDRRLREIAQAHGVRVHGTLWIMDQLVERHLLTPALAASSLDSILEMGSRLPPTECAIRMNRWERT